jgi:hypothetical protein
MKLNQAADNRKGKKCQTYEKTCLLPGGQRQRFRAERRKEEACAYGRDREYIGLEFIALALCTVVKFVNGVSVPIASSAQHYALRRSLRHPQQ